MPRDLLPLTLSLGAAFGLAVGALLVVATWGFAVLAAMRASEPDQARSSAAIAVK